MQDGTTKGFPSVSKKNWDEVISTDDVHAFAYLKPTLELMKVKNNIHKEVSKKAYMH